MHQIANTNFGNKEQTTLLKEGLQKAGIIVSLSWDLVKGQMTNIKLHNSETLKKKDGSLAVKSYCSTIVYAFLQVNELPIMQRWYRTEA